LALFHDSPPSGNIHIRFEKDLLAKLQALDSRAERKGLGSLDPSKNKLIPLGMEIDSQGRVTKNGYGVFHLAWKARKHPEWPAQIAAELEEIRNRIRERHKTRLRFVIWAGMGGSAEDKTMYNATGLLKGGPRLYVLDSTDPAKLKAILADMQKRSGLDEAAVLRSSLIVGMAMGMTSYEPVVNLEKIWNLFQKHKIDSTPNFIYMTLPGSLLDQFAGPRGYRRIPLQLDGGNSTAGRHSGPLTRGSLYPLGLAGADLKAWIEGACLSEEQIESALRLASFLEAQNRAGRDKVTLLLPREWAGAAVWTKQDFEESLGKSESTGIKIVTGEKLRLADYRPPKDPAQDRLFLAVQRKGEPAQHKTKIDALRRAGYPVAVLTLPPGAPLSAYMQFVHYTVFGLGYLRQMNFVTQPGVELYKAITSRIYSEASQNGGATATADWKKLKAPESSARFPGGVSLHFPYIDGAPASRDAARLYASLLRRFLLSRQARSAELTFFGDMRYSERGRALLRVLEKSAAPLFRSRLKVPLDLYEGPAMNHSYHEMIIGHGKCFTTVLLSEKQERIPAASYTADYHVCQFLATQKALAERGRPVAAILLRDLEEPTLAALAAFFREAARAVAVKE
jgi:glucose-6-phosphate isomerase